MATYASLDDGNAINSGGVAVFIAKVWRIVEDPEYKHLISWSENGKTVLVHDYSQFSKDVLPQYFKHCNFNSFVRQLNLYGFRKVTKAEQGSLLKAQSKEPIEFWHPHFRRGHPELLPDVQRRPVANKVVVEEKAPQLTKVVSDVHQINRRQESITTMLDAMKQENSHLRKEVAILKDKHDQQQKILDKIIQFLLHVVYKGGGITQKRKQASPLMLMDIASDAPSKRQKIDNRDVLHFEPTVEIEPIDSQPYSYQVSECAATVLPTDIDPMLSHSSPTVTSPSEGQTLTVSHIDGNVDVPSSPPPFHLDLIPELPITTATAETAVTSSDIPTVALSSISDHISDQQHNIDAIHDLLANGSTFTIDPSIFADYMTTDMNYVSGYDTVDTACLLDSLSGSDDHTQNNGYPTEPVASSHLLEDTTATDPNLVLSELLLEATPASIASTTTALATTTSTISRNKQ